MCVCVCVCCVCVVCTGCLATLPHYAHQATHQAACWVSVAPSQHTLLCIIILLVDTIPAHTPVPQVHAKKHMNNIEDLCFVNLYGIV